MTVRPQPALPRHGVPAQQDSLWFGLGAALLVIALTAFIVLARAVQHGEPITALDQYLALHLQRYTQEHSLLRNALWVITHLHSTLGALLLAGCAGYALLRRGARDWALTVCVAVPSGMLVNVLLKQFFMRPRPLFDQPLLSLATWSFPSGHTLAASVLYGVLTCYLLARSRAWSGRLALIVGGAGLVGLVALSRMFLGAHYLTDVLAAMAEGCVWVLLCVGARAWWCRVAAPAA